MIVAVLHDRVPPDASRDELDTLVQVDAVSRALSRLGCDTRPLEFTYDIEGFIEALRALKPEFVFNLVETLRGRGGFIGLAPLVLDHLKVPYTGCPAHSLFATSDKLFAKKVMKAAGIPTPPWVSLAEPLVGAEQIGSRFIIKSVHEHASIGMDGDASAVADGPEGLKGILEKKNERGEGSFFAERYVEGREFNVALLSGRRTGDGRRTQNPQTLAVSEMVFIGFPENKLKILDYRAKWEEGSREYETTVRNYDFPASDAPLLAELGKIALRCWDTFGLNGYARVDFRVDEAGRPFVLEINANPCIAPDSGFVAAAAVSKLGYEELIGRIVQNLVGPALAGME